MNKINMLIVIILLISIITPVYGEPIYRGINLDNINTNYQYKVLLLGIEKYESPGKNLMYTIDAIYEIHNIVISQSDILTDDIYTNYYVYPAMFWTSYIGGDNIINNYDYVIFAGHGSPYKIHFGAINTTFDNVELREAWFFRYREYQYPMIYSTRVNWFILFACETLNITREEFDILAKYVFLGNGEFDDVYLHGIVGAATVLYDYFPIYDNEPYSKNINKTSYILPLMKNTAERFSQYLINGYSVVDSWINAVLETQSAVLEEYNISIRPAVIYVYLDITYIDPFNGDMYHVIYNYSHEGFPGYGEVYNDPAVYLSNPFVYSYIFQIIYVEYGKNPYI